MPALTEPHAISIYGFQPEDRFAGMFLGLLKEIQPRNKPENLIKIIGELLPSTCYWEMHLSLTAQRSDYYGNPRPYDCEDLVEFLVDGTTLDPDERVFYRYMSPEDMDVLKDMIQQMLNEPLFPDEKAEWEALGSHLALFTGIPLVSVYSL